MQLFAASIMNLHSSTADSNAPPATESKKRMIGRFANRVKECEEDGGGEVASNGKCVRWCVAECAPERVGAWQAPRRLCISKTAATTTPGDTPRTSREQTILNLQNAGWQSGDTKRFDHAAPSVPTRRGSIEMNVTRRRSVLGSFLASHRQGSSQSLDAPETPVSSPASVGAARKTHSRKSSLLSAFGRAYTSDDSSELSMTTPDTNDERWNHSQQELKPPHRRRLSILDSLFRRGSNESSIDAGVREKFTTPAPKKVDAAPLQPSRRRSVETIRSASTLGVNCTTTSSQLYHQDMKCDSQSLSFPTAQGDVDREGEDTSG